MRTERKALGMEELARRQWGVVTVEQLLGLGFSRKEIHATVNRGRLHRVYRGVYACGLPSLLSSDARLLAAQLSCGPAAYLTRTTALGKAGVRKLYLPRIEITVPGRSVRPRAAPIVVRTTTVPPTPKELRFDGPLRYASVPRALLELATDTPVKQVDNLITEGIHRGKLKHDQMRALLAAHPHHPGAPGLLVAYRAYLPRPKSKSGLERAFDTQLKTRPWIPDPQRNILIEAGGIPWEIDRYWPEFHVGVELQGGQYHDPQPDKNKDEDKEAKLLAIGISLIHVNDQHFDLVPDRILDNLEAVLTHRGWNKQAA
jgi:hypothetical protein